MWKNGMTIILYAWLIKLAPGYQIFSRDLKSNKFVAIWSFWQLFSSLAKKKNEMKFLSFALVN